MKNGKPVSGKKDKKLHSEDKSSRVLVIEHTEEHDLGAYTCVATNQMGEATKEIILTGNPAKPKFVGIDNKDDEKTVVFKWKVKSYAPIKEYKVRKFFNSNDSFFYLPMLFLMLSTSAGFMGFSEWVY